MIERCGSTLISLSIVIKFNPSFVYFDLDWFGMVYISLRGKRQIATFAQFCNCFVGVFVAFCDGSFVHEGCTKGDVLLQRFKLYDTYMH